MCSRVNTFTRKERSTPSIVPSLFSVWWRVVKELFVTPDFDNEEDLQGAANSR